MNGRSKHKPPGSAPDPPPAHGQPFACGRGAAGPGGFEALTPIERMALGPLPVSDSWDDEPFPALPLFPAQMRDRMSLLAARLAGRDIRPFLSPDQSCLRMDLPFDEEADCQAWIGIRLTHGNGGMEVWVGSDIIAPPELEPALARLIEAWPSAEAALVPVLHAPGPGMRIRPGLSGSLPEAAFIHALALEGAVEDLIRTATSYFRWLRRALDAFPPVGKGGQA